MENKMNNMKKRSRLEDIILNLENKSKTDADKEQINILKEEFYLLKEQANIAQDDSHKLYLSEIIKKDKPKFGSNNLILAPVGSGKTSLIENVLLKNFTGKALMLVSNRYLKEDTCPHDNKLREVSAEEGPKMMFTTSNKKMYGNENYAIHTMTYSELGYRIRDNNDFVNDIDKIFCDEIHSLPEYRNINNDEGLTHAIKYLFNKQPNKTIFYFTATNENLIKLNKQRPNLMSNILTFDYRNHKNIKKYMNLSKYKINHIEQIRPHLSARKESFEYFKYKGLAFTKTIVGQKRIEDILIEEGYIPLVLWSDSNESNPLSNEQLKARKILIETGKIPKPYNFLVINSAMREGWDLVDDKIKLAIMNTTNDTDLIQARGRIRKDLDILVYRSIDTTTHPLAIKLDDRYIDNPLTADVKNNLCKKLKIKDKRGRIVRWTTVKKLLMRDGYDVFDKTMLINDRQTRVSIITDGKNNITNDIN